MWTLIANIAKPYALQIALIAAGLIAGCSLTYKITSTHYESLISATEEARQKAVIEAQALVIAEQEKSKTINKEVSSDYEKRINGLRANYDLIIKRLRNKASHDTNPMPSVPNASRVDNEATRATGFYGEDAEAFIALARDADLQTQQLVACQNWIKAHE